MIKGTELIAGRHVAQSNPQLSHSDSVSMISMRDLFSLCCEGFKLNCNSLCFSFLRAAAAAAADGFHYSASGLK